MEINRILRPRQIGRDARRSIDCLSRRNRCFKMDFKFKYVNEEQLMKVIKKVQRERSCKQDAADFVSLSSKERFAHVPKAEEHSQSEEEEVETVIDSQSVGDSANKEYSAFSSDKSRRLVEYGTKEKHREKVNILIIRLRNVRRNILAILDELAMHNERIDKKNNNFKDPNDNLDDKARNYICLIIRQEYPFVVNMRRLGLNTFRQDMVSHLTVLLDCHNIALRMLKIFIRGAPHTLKLDKSKEKLSCLLERMITLSSVCKIFSVEHSDIISSKDFLMDDVDRKCVSLLEYGKRRIKLVPICHEGKDLKCLGHLCAHAGVNAMTSDAKQNYERQITRRKFNKLADQVFGRKDKSTETIKKRKSCSKEHGIKNSKDKVYASKEENKTADIQDVGDPLIELEYLVHDVTSPQSCGMREAVSDLESRCKVEEGTKNLIEDQRPQDKEKCEILDAIHNNLPGGMENSLDNHQINISKLQPNNAHSTGDGIQMTVCSSMNNELQQEMSSFDNLKFLDDMKIFNTAGSIYVSFPAYLTK